MAAKKPDSPKVAKAVREFARSFVNLVGNQVAGARRIGQLLAMGSPSLVEPELDKQLDAIDKGHRKMIAVLERLRNKMGDSSLSTIEVRRRLRPIELEVYEAFGWGHSIHSLLTAWAEQLDLQEVGIRLQKRLQKLQAKEAHPEMEEAESRGGRRPPAHEPSMFR